MDESTGATEDAVVRVTVGSATQERAREVLSAARSAAGDVPVVEVGPTGVESVEPLLACTRDGTTALFAAPAPEAVERIVATVEGDGPAETEADAVVERDAESLTAPGDQQFPAPESGPLSVGRRRVLARAGWVDPTAADRETYAVAEASEEPAGALALARDVGLLGRGWGDGSADRPVADAWTDARETPGDPVVVVNANDADERNRTDLTLLEADPVSVLDGALAVAAAVDAEDVVVTVNEASDLAFERVEAAVKAFDGAVDAPRPQLFAAPDRYVAGEMTMALEALEGNDRLEARLRPPTPAVHGLYGRPTVVHTPRTCAHVREFLLDQSGYDPDDADPGTRLVTVDGDVAAPATVELPTGGSLETVREAVSLEAPFKMACVGGQFGGFTRTLAHAPSAPSLLGAHLGTEGVVELFGQDRCVLATAGRRARFAEEENCGRCVPCREGSKQLTNLLRDIYGGTYQDDMLRELTRVMRETSTCEFGRAAARPVVTGLHEFENEFEAHAEGRCPAGECEEA